jgi:hypothetical protein
MTNQGQPFELTATKISSFPEQIKETENTFLSFWASLFLLVLPYASEHFFARNLQTIQA